jgi:UDP-N-acetylmuramoylalanine--D-glutamate ligase
MDLHDKNILILGLAREGASLARFLSQSGASVTVTDSADHAQLAERKSVLDLSSVDCALGRHFPELVSRADMLFVSPGVPENNPVYEAARVAGLPVHSMTTLFFELCAGQIVGITGSSGKTTTTGLIGEILAQAGSKFVLGGNIGDPMLDLLASIDEDTIVVLELSSFQLTILQKSPHVAVVTNISPNHLDRHLIMQNYVAAKRHVVEHQGERDFAVLNASDPAVRPFARSTRGAVQWFGWGASSGVTVRDDHLGLLNQSFEPVLPVAEIPLLGRHNVENAMAAVAAANVLGVQMNSVARGIKAYTPSPHRLQIVAVQDGVTYIDDSIATSPARASVALESFDRSILLIAGGRDKKLAWQDFAKLVVRHVRSLFLIGEAADLIEREVRGALAHSDAKLRPEAIRRCSSLDEAVREASRQARSGDVVLLSPACTSYDMFADFEQRGESFRRAVEELTCGVA